MIYNPATDIRISDSSEKEEFSLRNRVGIFLVCTLLLIAFGAVSVFLIPKTLSVGKQTKEMPVVVVGISQSDTGEWRVMRDAVADRHGPNGPLVARLKHLRAEKLGVEIMSSADDGLLIRNAALEASDLLIVKPEMVPSGQAVSISGGLEDERLIQLTLEAGFAAAMAEDLDESTRFLSTSYHDANGFNSHLMHSFLRRAFSEFDQPRIELAEAPTIQIKGKEALVQTKIKLDAVYRGQRNYLLGGQNSADEVMVVMEKVGFGWKVSAVQGLSPLGLGERFLRLLGAEVGLSLSEGEVREKREACMPCRQRMAERFGTGFSHSE